MRAKKRRSKRLIHLKSVEQIPEFHSLEEEAEFWDSHSPVEILDQLEPVKLELAEDLKKKIEERYRERLLSLCLDSDQIRKAKQIAKKRGVGYLVLLKQWIQAGITRELKKSHRGVSR